MIYEKVFTQGKIFIITNFASTVKERDEEIRQLFPNGEQPDWDVTFTDPTNLDMKELEDAIVKNCNDMMTNAMQGIPCQLIFVKSVQDYLIKHGKEWLVK